MHVLSKDCVCVCVCERERERGSSVTKSSCLPPPPGFISQQGLSVDPQSSSILQLQRTLLALLRGQGTRKGMLTHLAGVVADMTLFAKLITHLSNYKRPSHVLHC